MRVSQYIYTNCANNNNFPNGYVIYGKTEDINEEDARFIQRVMDYKLRSEYPYNADAATIDRDFPRKLAYFPLPSGRMCFGQSAYIGLDSAGNRYGNYMIHAFVFEKGADIDPYQFANSEIFRRRLSKEEMLGPIPGTLPPLEVSTPAPKQGELHIESDDAFKQLMVFLRNRDFTPNDKIYIRLKPEDYPILLNIISRQVVKNGEPIPFMTYLNNRFENKETINLLFETEPLSTVTNTVFGTFKVVYFDLLENKCNVDLKIDSFDNTWLSLLRKNEKEAADFVDSIEDIKRRYNVPNNLGAYACKIVLAGEYHRLGSTLKAIEIYNKYLHPYHLSDIADSLFNALSENEKEDVNIINSIFADLSAPVKNKIFAKYARRTLTSVRSIDQAANELVNVPFGTVNDLLRVVFSQECFNEFFNLSDYARSVLFALCKYIDINENNIIQIAKAIGDKVSVLDLYERYLFGKRLNELASFIYKEVRNANLPLSRFERIYPNLKPEDKEEILFRFFKETMDKQLPYDQVINTFSNDNAFADARETLRVLLTKYFNKLLNYGDYGIHVAIRLSVYGTFRKEEIFALYNQLSVKNISQERDILATANFTKSNGVGEMIASDFIEKNGANYQSEQEIIRVIRSLDKFPSVQASFIVSSIDNNKLSLKNAFELVNMYQNLPGPRIDLLRKISSNRNNPTAVQEICEKSDDNIAKVYMATLFEEDKHRVFTSISGIDAALKLYRENPNLNKEELEKVIKEIFNANFSSLIGKMNYNLFKEIYDKAREKGADMRPMMTYYVYHSIKQASMGDRKFIAQLGYDDGKDIYANAVITDEFVKNIFDYCASIITATSEENEQNIKAVHALLFKLADNPVTKQKVMQMGNERFVKVAVAYVKKHKEEKDNLLVLEFGSLIKAFLKENKRDKELPMRLGIAPEDTFESVKKESHGSLCFCFNKKDKKE